MTVFYISTFFVFVLYLIIEYFVLQSRIRKIPLRILVNGTRGKSTTVKIIHNILKKSGKKVFAKTTGDVPLLIYPDGSQKEIKRFAPASIIENVMILKKAAKENPDAVVLECMALQPETQHVLSRHIFKPNYTIVTNIHFDHAEVMGPDITDTAKAVNECFCKNSSIILTEETMELLSKLPHYHADMHLTKNKESSARFENIPAQILNENWSLIAALCKRLDIDKKPAHQCFADAWKSIDQRIKLLLPNQKVELWNLFSANDIQTTKGFIKNRFARNSFSGKLIFYLNCRADRPLRTKEFVKYITEEYRSAEIWLTGDGKYLAKNLFKGFPMHIHLISDQQALQNIKRDFSQETLLFCVGNFKSMDNFISEIESLSKNQQVERNTI